MGKIFYIMGKSASGKDHIYARLVGNKNLGLKKLVPYTTRPIRDGEEDGKQYFFVKEEVLREFQKRGCVIEERNYQTVHGIWTYFTADDGQVDLKKWNYLGIGTLESYVRLKDHYGAEALCPIYVQVEDGERLFRAWKREKEQEHPKFEEMCRRFLADQDDFSEEKIRRAGIERRFQNDDLERCVEEIQEYMLPVAPYPSGGRRSIFGDGQGTE